MALTFPHAGLPPRAEPLFDSVADWTGGQGSRHLRLAEPERADVVLVTEGTYPYARGGVSVWCDQVVSGLSELSFRVAALTAFGHQEPTYELPDHVADFRRIGLWDGSLRYRAAGRSPVAPLAGQLASLLAAPEDDVPGFLAFVDELMAWSGPDITGQLRFGELLRALDEAVVRTPRWWALEGVRMADLVQVAETLDHLLRTLTFDIGPAAVYHATSNGLAALACMVASRRHGGRFLLSEHGVYLRERYLELRRLALARPAKALLVRFHRLVTAAAYAEASVTSPCSDWNQRWERRFGARPLRLRTVYNGIDPERFPAREADADDPGPVVAWLGRIDPLKDLETLIRSFRIVCDKRPDARLRLFGLTPAGNEEYRAELDRLVDELDLAEAVTFEGGVPHGSAAYGEARICVLSSISEGFPYALIEGMACGLPAVATGVGGVAEALDGQTGIVVLPRSPDLFGAAILELIDDPERCRRMGAQARQRVEDEFTLDRCLAGYRLLYQQLAAEADHERTVHCGAGAAGSRPGRSGPPGHHRRPEGQRSACSTGDGGRAWRHEPVQTYVVDVLSEAHGAPGLAGRSRNREVDADDQIGAAGERRPLEPQDYDALVAAIGGLDALRAAVDVEEVTAALESVGVTDQVAIQRFGSPDVFQLAERVWVQSEGGAMTGTIAAANDRGGHRGGESGSGEPGGGGGGGGGGRGRRPGPPRPEPVLPSARGALARGVAYVLPAVAVAAASLKGATHVALVAASVLGWGLAQGGGMLAYTVINRSPTGSGIRPLRSGMLVCVAGVTLAGIVAGALAGPAAGAAFTLPLLYLVGSCALIMASRTGLLLAVLAPATGLSLAVLFLPGPGPRTFVAPAAAITVVAILLLVGRELGTDRRGRGPRLIRRDDWLAAAPLVACGWLSAGCAVLSVRALAHVDGLVGIDEGAWLLLALPLWTMVVGSELLLLRLRRSLRSLLHMTTTVADFQSQGRWVVVCWLTAAAATLAASLLLTMATAGLPALAAWQASSVFLYLSLAFVGVTVLYTTPRVGPALVALSTTVLALAMLTLSSWEPLGVADHTLALVICATSAVALCRTAATTLVDPASHR